METALSLWLFAMVVIGTAWTGLRFGSLATRAVLRFQHRGHEEQSMTTFVVSIAVPQEHAKHAQFLLETTIREFIERVQAHAKVVESP